MKEYPWANKRNMGEKSILKISNETVKSIIQTRTPLGLFYTIGSGVFVAIDNSDGNAWVEEFKTLPLCKAWLKRELELL